MYLHGVTKSEEVEERLFNEEIKIVNFGLESEYKAFCINKDEFKAICIDNSKITTSKEKRCILEHEYEHLRLPKLMYQLDACAYEIAKKERIINRELIKRLIPFDKLKSLLKAHKQLHEIAEELEVTEALLCAAIDYYKDLGDVINEVSENVST